MTICPDGVFLNDNDDNLALHLAGIGHGFGDKTVLQNINLSLPQGSIAALVGASGVGKSTLFNIVAGLIVPTTGDVFGFGRCITGKAGQAGYMLQKDMLLPFKSVYDNIALPLTLKGVDKALIAQKVHDLLPQFGLEGVVYQYPKALSGGQRQRAALLRTYLSHDRLMLLDEPFSALDYVTKHAMYDWFCAFQKRSHLSCLIITHDIDEALKLADTVYVLKGVPASVVLSLDTYQLDTTQYSDLKERILGALSA